MKPVRLRPWGGECCTKEWVATESRPFRETWNTDPNPEEDRIFDFWWAFQLFDSMESSDPDPKKPRFWASLNIVAPKFGDPDELRAECGDWLEGERDIAGAMFERGEYARVWQHEGHDPMVLMKMAVEKAQNMTSDDIAEALDGRANLLGENWWSFLRRDWKRLWREVAA